MRNEEDDKTVGPGLVLLAVHVWYDTMGFPQAGYRRPLAHVEITWRLLLRLSPTISDQYPVVHCKGPKGNVPSHFHFPASEQAVVTGVVPSPPRFLPLIFIAHRVQQSHCSSIFHRALLTHALALYASQFVHKKRSPRIYTSMHSGGLELTKPNHTRLEDNLTRHPGNRLALQRSNKIFFHHHYNILVLIDTRGIVFPYRGVP